MYTLQMPATPKALVNLTLSGALLVERVGEEESCQQHRSWNHHGKCDGSGELNGPGDYPFHGKGENGICHTKLTHNNGAG